MNLSGRLTIFVPNLRGRTYLNNVNSALIPNIYSTRAEPAVVFNEKLEIVATLKQMSENVCRTIIIIKLIRKKFQILIYIRKNVTNVSL